MIGPIEEHPSGAVVYQVTDDDFPKSDIYCELPYCSVDSRRFVYMRTDASRETNPTDYIVVDFGTWEAQVVGQGLGDWEIQTPGEWIGGPAMSRDGVLFYRRSADTCQELVRLDLSSLTTKVVFELPPDYRPRGNATVSPDERYICYGVTLSWSPQLFGIEAIDLEKGSREVIVEDPYICNPHTQFDPTHGRRVMVQHNRGCRFTPEAVREAMTGPEGATEFLVDIPSGRIARLMVGTPHTPPISGHEAWVSGSDEMLFTVRAEGAYSIERGNLIGIRPDGSRRTVASGYNYNHVGTSPCGQYFWADDYRDASTLTIGSVASGRTAVVCDARTSMGRLQASHAHPWCSPDMKWVVFNSDRTGRTEIYAARIPGHLPATVLE